MRKILILSFLLLNVLILYACNSQNNEQFSTVVFYSPHADDEVLSMGASILKSIDEKKEIIVVLLSKGQASSAFSSVNKRLDEVNLPPISLEEFGEARVNEYKESLLQLGVKKDNIFVYNLPDGNFSSHEIEKIMAQFQEKFPNSQHHTMTYLDPHPDHAAAGQALKNLKDKGILNSAIYHLPIQEFENIEYQEEDRVSFFNRKKYKKALDSYGIWSPNEGFYSIGQNSVSNYFLIAEEVRSSRWHR